MSELPQDEAFRMWLTPYLEALDAVMLAALKAEVGRVEGMALLRAETRLAEVIRSAMQTSDVLSRKVTLANVRRVADVPMVPAVAPGLPRVPPLDVIADILARDPVLAEGWTEVAQAYGDRHVFALARSTSQHATERAQQAIAHVLHSGEGVDAGAARLVEIGREEAQAWTRSYAETALRTNTSTAATAGQWRAVSTPAVRRIIGGFTFHATKDSSVRPNHLAAHGLTGGLDDPVWQTMSAPLGFRCFLPGTVVSGCVQVASKAPYSGPAVEIKTHGGRRLRVTVNHPILTRDGWVAAGDLEEGRDLVCYGYGVESLAPSPLDRGLAPVLERGRGVDDEKGPAAVEDVFDALMVEGVASTVSRVPVFPLDLHGDAQFVTGDVHVVSVDGVLPLHGEPSGSQEHHDVPLVDNLRPRPTGHADRSLSDLQVGVGASFGRSPGGGALPADDLPVPRLALASLPLQGLRFGPAADVNVRALEAGGYGAAADADLPAQLQDACPGLVSADEVIEVNRFDFSGHVYDLQTASGWIVAGGIVSSNCRCNMTLRTWPDLRRHGLLIGPDQARPARIPQGAFPDPGFRVSGRPDLDLYSEVGR